MSAADEAARLRALQALCAAQGSPDPVLDGLVRVAAQSLRCPVAAFSLINATHQRFLATLGFNAGKVLLPRELSLCEHTLAAGGFLAVADTHLDPRFAAHTQHIGGKPLRFYAGVPIEIDGCQLGTFCVVDHVPRELTDAERGILVDLARAAAQRLLAQHEHAELERHRDHLNALVDERTAALTEAKAAAEAASLAKSAFLAVMSHEIRTPMSGVIGAVELLERTRMTQYQRELAVTVRDSSVALMALIDSILDFSKIEAGHLSVEHAPVALRELLENSCDALQPLAMSRGVHVHLFVDPTLPEQVLSDVKRLRQVVTNLLANAIKFSAGLDRAGRVALRVCRVHGVAGPCLRIEFLDNGIGITPETQARLFRPFVQAENGSARRYGGTGLGLAICQRVTVALGGHIGIRSVLGEGACFSVELPLLSHAAARPMPHDLSGIDCHLVVADAQWRQDWGVYLAAAGANVTAWSTLPRAADIDHLSPRAALVVQVDLIGEGGEGDVALALPRVELCHGRRRVPRALGRQRVQVDLEGLHRDAMLLAVAMAAGRAKAPHSVTRPALDGEPLHAADLVGASQRRQLVLVAEDNATNRMVIERQLALLGVHAVIVETPMRPCVCGVQHAMTLRCC